MNIQDSSVTLGPTLQVHFWPYFNCSLYTHSAYTGHLVQELKEFCGSFDAGMKGLTLSNSDQVEEISKIYSFMSAIVKISGLYMTCTLCFNFYNRYFFQILDQNCAQFLRQADAL